MDFLSRRTITKGMVLLGILISLGFAFGPSRWKNASFTDDSGKVGVSFVKTTWSQTLLEAQKQHKMVFLDAYASWCGPCMMLKHRTFTSKGVGAFFNEHFLNISVDMERGEGPDLAEKFGIVSYPTLIFTNGDGKIVSYTVGYLDSTQIIEFGNYALKLAK